MDDWKRNLQGSEAKDVFKRRHKQALPTYYYAVDADLILMSKFPPGVVAYIDFKRPDDSVTFAEAMYYNEVMTEAPVFIVESDDPEDGPFIIGRYLGGDWKPNPPDVEIEFVTEATDWQEFGQWECSLRQEYSRRKGWNGQLRGNEP
jgi:hypothetical protein